jgi:thiol-disulfide isomerase/thioredoxin
MARDIQRRGFLGGLSAAFAAVAGCLGSDDEDENDSMASGDGGGGDNKASEDGDDSGETVERAEWQTAQLSDPVSGESFRIADLDGPVVVHPFAIWCTVCSRQNQQLGSLGTDTDHEVVQLNIETAENSDSVRSYAEDNGYVDTCRFAVAPEAVSGSLVDEFGPSAVSPPQSPVILVCSNGETHMLDKIVGADRIDSALNDLC